jgi:hypothetical protein
MKISKIIGLGVALVAVAGVAVYIAKKVERRNMLNQIADEGYETAHDILFPGKSLESGNLQYGPVIPA